METGAGIRGIFFDAGGTLIEPRYPVGEIYAALAAEFGQQVDPLRLQANFYRLFPLQPALAFRADLPPETRQRKEMEWWRQLVSEVFADLGPFPAFEPYFTQLYHSFEKAELWQLVEGVLPTLEILRDRGFILGIASNFDSRLFSILREMGLSGYFSAVKISSMCESAKPAPHLFRLLLDEMGLSGYFSAVKISSMCESAKPAPHLFRLLLDELGLEPGETVHIGDSWREDIEGALGTGMMAILLDRQQRFIDNPSLSNLQTTRIDRFDQLAEIDLLQAASTRMK